VFIGEHIHGGNMRDALVFNCACQLDFQEVRANVIRIPEVVDRIRQAQKIWDSAALQPLDITNFIASDDSIFLRQIRLKSFATAVVQVGLLDRYLRSHAMPEFLVGTVNGDAPLNVAIGRMSFVDLIMESAALAGGSEPNLRVLPAGELPVLSGVQLSEYAVYRANASSVYEREHLQARDIESMLVELVDHHAVNKIITVGPGNAVLGRKIAELTSQEVHVLESIDLDPLLTWFWAGQRENRLAIAN